jgi:hypothetical protein
MKFPKLYSLFACGALAAASATADAYTLIDSFDMSLSDQYVDRDNPASEATLDDPGLPPDPDPNLAPNILGDYRDLYVHGISGSDTGPFGFVSLFSFAPPLSKLDFTAGDPGTLFTGRITWDGQDSDGAAVDVGGLGSVALNANGENAFSLLFANLRFPNTTLEITVWSDAGNAQATAMVDLSTRFGSELLFDPFNPAYEELTVPFLDFSDNVIGTVDFGDVSAIMVEFYGPAGWEVGLKEVASVAVPEPASIALMGAGLIGLGWRRRIIAQ